MLLVGSRRRLLEKPAPTQPAGAVTHRKQHLAQWTRILRRGRHRSQAVWIGKGRMVFQCLHYLFLR